MGSWRVIADVQSGSSIRPTRAEVDLGAVVDNARALRTLAGVDLLAVVKADAYGHGAVACARALAEAGDVSGLAVSLVEEGSELRAAGIAAPILVMGPSVAGGHDELVARGMTPLVSDEGDLERFAELGRQRGAPVEVHLKVDTGMGRLGIAPGRVGAVVERAAGSGVRLVGLATHFACADDDDPADPDSITARQLAVFRGAIAAARAAGATELALHAANSAALLRFPDARFALARPGLALYGNGDPGGAPLRQAMRLLTAIAQLRDAESGQAVSYGALWRARRRSRLAVLPVGYADGLPRSLSGRASALVRGRRCPLVGAISMDMAIADVTDLGDEVAVGDEAVLLGGQEGERISAAEFAAAAGLTEYEVTCGISKRVPREHA